jgi:hypothetical protein
MFGLSSLSGGGGGGGGGPTSTATSGSSQGNDVYNYGTFSPAAPPSQIPTWLYPAIAGAAVLILLLTRK